MSGSLPSAATTIIVKPRHPALGTEIVGEPEIFRQTSLNLRSDRVKEIFLVSNVDENDRLMTPVAPSQKQLSSSRQWHTDASYRPMPSIGSLLHGIEISRTGGVMRFIDLCLVYDDLPDRLRREVECRKARHDFGILHRITGAPSPTAEGQAKMPAVWHPPACHSWIAAMLPPE